MRVKVFLLLTGLLLGVIHPAAGAAPKVNSTCTKVGAVTIVNKQRLICKKEGNKRLWKIDKSKSTSTKDVGAKSQINIPGFKIVRDQIFEITPDRTKEPRIRMVASPGVQRDLAARALELSEEASQFFQRFFQLDEEINLWLISEGDIPFFEKLLSDKTEKTRNRLIEYAKYTVGGGQAGSLEEGGLIILYILPKSGQYSARDGLRYFIYHEMAHVFQWKYAGYFGMQANVPCWYGEGFADLLGYSRAVTDKNFLDSAYQSRYRVGATLFGQFREGGFYQIPKMVEIMAKECPWRSPLQYELGLVMAEKFVLDYGLSGWVKLSSSLGDEVTDVIFKRITGLTQEEWYTQSAAPYVIAALQGKERTYTSAEAEELASLIAYRDAPATPSPRTYGRTRPPGTTGTNTEPNPNPSGDPEELSDQICTVENEMRKTSKGEYMCQKRSDVLRWSKNNKPSN